MCDKIRFEQNCAHDEIIYILIILYVKENKMQNYGEQCDIWQNYI